MTTNELKEKLINANFKKISLQMNNGDTVTITPMSQMVQTIRCTEDVEYYLVESPSLPYLGNDDFNKVVEELNNYDKLIADNEAEKKKLQEYFEQNLADKIHDPNQKANASHAFQFYSDWYKDVYGRRPRL